MKRRYHIAIDKNNWNIFRDVFAVLSINPELVSKLTSTNGWIQYNYLVDLSKYELLYLRLACPMKSLKEITKVEVV
jgi:hypothetical protein